jgi:hypothetical protein
MGNIYAFILIIVFLFADQDSANWIGEHYGEIVKNALYLLGAAIGYGRMKERVTILTDEVKKLRDDVDHHTDDKDCHIDSRVYEGIMKRFDSLELQIKTALDWLKQKR